MEDHWLNNDNNLQNNFNIIIITCTLKPNKLLLFIRKFRKWKKDLGGHIWQELGLVATSNKS